MKQIYILLVVAMFSLNSAYAQKAELKIKTAKMVSTPVNFSSNNKDLKVYPNPSSNFIQIKGLHQAENYLIYNFEGVIVSKGNVSSSDKIDVQHLKNGIYYLVFEEKDKLIFVKE